MLPSKSDLTQKKCRTTCNFNHFHELNHLKKKKKKKKHLTVVGIKLPKLRLPKLI